MSFVYSNLNSAELIDVDVYTCGVEICESGHSYGPAIRSGYIVHYVLNGKGKFRSDGITYYLKKGQGFLIEPETLIYYEADQEDPWEYIWIGFNGRKAGNYIQQTNLSYRNPIFSVTEPHIIHMVMDDILKATQTNDASGLLVLSKLYTFLHLFVSSFPNEKNDVSLKNRNDIERALYYIQQNYSESLTIKSISDYLHIDRSYLHRLFKKHVGKSPQRYLIDLRIEKAKLLLEQTTYKISVVARSVGYTDPLLFSKTFKRYMNMSPSEFRENKLKI